MMILGSPYTTLMMASQQTFDPSCRKSFDYDYRSIWQLRHIVRTEA